MLLGDGCAQPLQALDVQVNRPGANGAAPGQRDARASGARQQRPQHQGRGAHGLHQLVGSLGRGAQAAAVDGGAVMGAPVSQLDLGAHGHQQLARSLNVAHVGHVLQDHRLIGEQSRSHGRQRGILGPADANRAQQRIPPANYEFIHFSLSFSALTTKDTKVKAIPDSCFLWQPATGGWQLFPGGRGVLASWSLFKSTPLFTICCTRNRGTSREVCAR